MYAKDNQILYSAKFSQGFKVVAAKRAWQAAGVSGEGAKIRVSHARDKNRTLPNRIKRRSQS